MEAEVLLQRLESGDRLSRAERDWVRQTLEEALPDEDEYTLLHVLRKDRDQASKTLIQRCASSGDEMVRRLALQALSDLFPNDETWITVMAGVRDRSPHVRMAALTRIGDLGAALPNRRAEAAAFLVDEFERLRRRRGPEWESCYQGLLNLTSWPYNKRPLATRALHESDVNPEVIVDRPY
jgi:hypothetical protein